MKSTAVSHPYILINLEKERKNN